MVTLLVLQQMIEQEVFYSGGNTGNQLDMRIATLSSLGDTVDGGGDLLLLQKAALQGFLTPQEE